jgi:flagellar motor switch protein FliM
MTHARDAVEGTAQVTPTHALRLALAKAGNEVLDTRLLITSIDETRVGLKDFLAQIDEHSVILLLNGLHGDHGVAIVDAPLLAGIIEAQTTGRVTGQTAKVRTPTRTDGAMCKTVLTRALTLFSTMLANEPGTCGMQGYMAGRQISGAHRLELELDDIRFRLFSLAIEMGDNVKSGTLRIAFDEAAGMARPDCGGTTAQNSPREWAAKLDHAVMDGTVEISAILYRTHKPLAEITALVPGSVIELPLSAISELALEGVNGTVFSTARLGQRYGRRAVCLTQKKPRTPAAPDIAEPESVAPPIDDLATPRPLAPPEPVPVHSAADNPE